MSSPTRRSLRTTDAAGQPTGIPQPKVIAGAVGAGVGAAASELGIWIVESAAGIDIPSAVEGSITVLVVAAVGFLAGYIKRPSAIN